MNALFIHSNELEFEAKKKTKLAEKLSDDLKKQKIEECLTVFMSFEEADNEKEESVTKNLIKNIKEISEKIGTKNIVLYPYVHLLFGKKPSTPETALKIMKLTETELKKQKFEVHRAPFGYYKSFHLFAKGHPLSELSREIHGVSNESIGDNKTYEKLISFLNKNKAEYRLIDHEPESKIELVSSMRGNELREAANCIVLMLKIEKKTKYVLAVFPGDRKIDFEKIKQLFKAKYVSFANQKIAENLTGSVLGIILPFSFNNKLELVVDPELLKNNEIFFNAARLDKSIALKVKDYKRIVKPRLEKISMKVEDDISESLKQEETLKSSWNILDLNGKLHEIKIENGKVKGFDFKKYANLEKFCLYEMAKSRKVDKEPLHVELMKRHGIANYEPGSDPGNLRYPPKGKLMKALIEEYTSREMHEAGALEVEGPIMFDYDHPALKKYLNRFPARQYTIQTPNKKVFLRFSACFFQFLLLHDAQLSYKDLPIWLYELTKYSFRVEQRGELTGLRRLRAFTMPDCHAFVADLNQAKQEFKKRFELARKIQTGIGLKLPEDLEFAIRIVKPFWEANKDFVKKMVKDYGKPALVELWDKQFAYFILKYELNFVDNLGKAVALTTDQIDVENGKTFDINFVTKDDKKEHPLILHLSPTGAIERVLLALLEKAAAKEEKNEKGSFPLWLAPTQIRLALLNDKVLGFAEKLREKLKENNIRVDIDDRSIPIGKKIREAELEWIPYILVIGNKEVESEKLSVRFRETSKSKEMTLEELIQEISNQTKQMPFRALPLPYKLSRRPDLH